MRIVCNSGEFVFDLHAHDAATLQGGTSLQLIVSAVAIAVLMRGREENNLTWGVYNLHLFCQGVEVAAACKT